eukprot:7000428-Pyramimonas_sp.AAC.1
MSPWKATHEVVVTKNTLEMSEISSVEKLGELWHPGTLRPLALKSERPEATAFDHGERIARR